MLTCSESVARGRYELLFSRRGELIEKFVLLDVQILPPSANSMGGARVFPGKRPARATNGYKRRLGISVSEIVDCILWSFSPLRLRGSMGSHILTRCTAEAHTR